MKKPFCDICGKPAMEQQWFKAAMNVGEPRTGYETEHDGSGCEKTRQCVAVASVQFTFEQHQTGYGGPPDLCAEHARELVKMIHDRIPAP